MADYDDFAVQPSYDYVAPTPKLVVNGISVDAPTLNPVGNGYSNPYYSAFTNKGEHAADVYASAGQGIRLLAPDGTVIFEGKGPDAARDATALANYISQTDGKKAAWDLQVENPNAPGEYQRAGYETVDKKKGGGILGALLDIALPILANIVLPGSGFLASALAGAAGSGVSSAIQGRSVGDALKAAALAGVGSGVGSALSGGANAASSGALKGLTTTPSSLTSGLSAGVSSLPSMSLAAIPQGLTGTGSLISALGSATGGLSTAAFNELSPLVVQASNLAKGGMGLSELIAAGVPQAVAQAVTADLAKGVDPEQEVARYYPEGDEIDPLTVEVPGGAATGSTTGSTTGSAIGAGVGSAAGDLLSPVEVTPQRGYGNDLDGLNIFPGMSPQLGDYGNLSVNNSLPPGITQTQVPDPYATDLDPLEVTATKPGLEGLTTVPTVITPPTDYSWLTPAEKPTIPDLDLPIVPVIPGGGGGGKGGGGVDLTDLIPLIGAGLGGAGGGGSGGTATPIKVTKPPTFNATSPQFKLNPANPRDISLSREEWARYGSQPETSFFDNVPIQPTGISDGGEWSPYTNEADNAVLNSVATPGGLAVQPPSAQAPPPPATPSMSVAQPASLAVQPSGLSATMQALQANPLALRGQASTLMAKDFAKGLTGDQIAIEKAKNPYWPYANMTDASLGRNSVLANTQNPIVGPTWQQNNYANSPKLDAWMNYNSDGMLVTDPQFGHINKAVVGDPGWSSLPEQVTTNDLAVQKAKYDAAQAAQKASDEVNVRQALAGSGRTDYVGYDKELGYAEGGFAVHGAGDGRSDSIRAKLSDGEYVVDAETVALLGDGSSRAGAKVLDQFRVNVRKHKGAELAKGRFSGKAKPAMAYMAGGRG